MNKYRDPFFWMAILVFVGAIAFMLFGCSPPKKEKAIVISHSQKYANTFKYGYNKNGFIVMAVCPECGK